MITPTMGQVRDALKAAMETQGPDFRYNSNGTGPLTFCFNVPLSEVNERIRRSLYWEPDDPRTVTGCLVGTALEILGVPHDYLVRHASSDIHSLSSSLDRDNVMDLAPGATNYLSYAQTAQDRGGTWGEAFAKAEASL